MDVARVVTSPNNGPFGEVHFPVVAYNPNAGFTYGLLPVWLVHNRRGEIGQIIAPMITTNKTFGPTLSGNYYLYPTDHSKLIAYVSKSSRSNHRAAAAYEDLRLFDGAALIRANANIEADGGGQFYGVGPATTRAGEESVRMLEDLVDVEFGVRASSTWAVSAGWKARRTQAQAGPFPAPQPIDPRLEISTVYSLPRVVVSRDTRDLPYTPTEGSLVELFIERSARRLGSAADYGRYGGQWRWYAPAGDRLTLAFHAQAEWSGGGAVPLSAYSSLGGPRSVRGFPEGRFQDRGSAFANVEARWRLHSLDLLKTVTDFQAAPFFDSGTVFPTPGRVRSSRFDNIVGLALRAVVKPTVVGRVEFGVGREGLAAFVGVDYPF